MLGISQHTLRIERVEPDGREETGGNKVKVTPIASDVPYTPRNPRGAIVEQLRARGKEVTRVLMIEDDTGASGGDRAVTDDDEVHFIEHVEDVANQGRVFELYVRSDGETVET